VSAGTLEKMRKRAEAHAALSKQLEDQRKAKERQKREEDERAMKEEQRLVKEREELARRDREEIEREQVQREQAERIAEAKRNAALRGREEQEASSQALSPSRATLHRSPARSMAPRDVQLALDEERLAEQALEERLRQARAAKMGVPADSAVPPAVAPRVPDDEPTPPRINHEAKRRLFGDDVEPAPVNHEAKRRLFGDDGERGLSISSLPPVASDPSPRAVWPSHAPPPARPILELEPTPHQPSSIATRDLTRASGPVQLQKVGNLWIPSQPEPFVPSASFLSYNPEPLDRSLPAAPAQRFPEHSWGPLSVFQGPLLSSRETFDPSSSLKGDSKFIPLLTAQQHVSPPPPRAIAERPPSPITSPPRSHRTMAASVRETRTVGDTKKASSESEPSWLDKLETIAEQSADPDMVAFRDAIHEYVAGANPHHSTYAQESVQHVLPQWRDSDSEISVTELSERSLPNA
jgi:hypothetical protein